MGRVIKSKELCAPPLRLAERRRRRLLELLTPAVDDATELARGRERTIELALAIARRIVGRTVELEPSVLDQIYRRSLAELGELEPTRIRVFPADRARSDVERLAAELGCTVVDDRSVGPGGCLIEAEGAEVDASMDVLLGVMRGALEARTVE